MILILRATILGITICGWHTAAHTVVTLLHHPLITVFSVWIALVVVLLSRIAQNGVSFEHHEHQVQRLQRLATKVWGKRRPSPTVSTISGGRILVHPDSNRDQVMVGIRAANSLNDKQLTLILAHEYFHCDHPFQGFLQLSRTVMEALFVMTLVNAVILFGTPALVSSSIGLLASALADQLNEILMDLQAARRLKVKGQFVAETFATFTKVRRLPLRKRLLNALLGLVMTPVRTHPPVEIRLLIQRMF
jgi:hypothetical protein